MRTIDKGIPHAMQLVFPVFQTIGANSYIGAYTCDFVARTTAGRHGIVLFLYVR